MPAKQFFEYPKIVRKDGKGHLVRTADEEAALIALWYPSPDAAHVVDDVVTAPDNVGNALMGPPPTPPKAKGGWPKGKPRTAKAV